MLKIIDEHAASFDPEHLRDLIDVYILEVKERERELYHIDKKKLFWGAERLI